MGHPKPTFHVESAGATLEFLPLLILEIFASEIDGGRMAYSTQYYCTVSYLRNRNVTSDLEHPP